MNKLHIRQTYNDYSRTYQEVKQILETDNKIKGIYMANRTTTACAEAVCKAGYQGKLHVNRFVRQFYNGIALFA